MYSIFSSIVVWLGLVLLLVFRKSLSELTQIQKVVIILIGIFSIIALLVALPDAVTSFMQGWHAFK